MECSRLHSRRRWREELSREIHLRGGVNQRDFSSFSSSPSRRSGWWITRLYWLRCNVPLWKEKEGNAGWQLFVDLTGGREQHANGSLHFLTSEESGCFQTGVLELYDFNASLILRFIHSGGRWKACWVVPRALCIDAEVNSCAMR